MLSQEPASGLGHRDLDAADFALGVDLYVLLVAVGPQIQVCGKSGSLDEHVDLAAAGSALQIAEDIPALFAPIAGDTVTLAGDVAGEVEFVAVAGAMQVLRQAEPVGVDLVVGLAADVFRGAVGKGNIACAGPISVKTGKGACGLCVACGDRHHERGADASSGECLPEEAKTKAFHSEFSHQNRRSYERHVSPHRRFSVPHSMFGSNDKTPLAQSRGGRRHFRFPESKASR